MTVGLSVLVFWMLTLGLLLLEVFMAVNNDTLVSWVMTPCSQILCMYQCCRPTDRLLRCFVLQFETAGSVETSECS
jgi:hypothetical protein